MHTVDLSFLRPPRRLQMIWNTGDGESAAYSGHLRDVERNQLAIQLLGYGLVPCALRAGEQVHIEIPDGPGIYDLPGEVISEAINGDLRVAVTGEVRRRDRRQYPRAQVSLTPTTAFVLQAGAAPPRRITVRITELSGGGARFESFQPLDAGQVVQLLVPLPGHHPVFPIMTVLETTTPATNGAANDGRVLARAEFTRVLQDDRRQILRYVAKEREFSGSR